MYLAPDPADITPRGATAILIREHIKYYELPKFQKKFLQLFSFVVFEDFQNREETTKNLLQCKKYRMGITIIRIR